MSISSEISSRPSTSDTHIKSRSWLWAGRAAFFAVCAATLIFSVRLLPLEIDYLDNQADAHLTGAQAPLYFVVMMTRNLTRLVMIVTGIFIFWRKSQDRIGVLVALALVTMGAAGINFYQFTPQGTALLQENNLMWGNWLSGMAWFSVFVFLMLFPDGRFVPRGMAYHLIFALGVVAAWGLPSDHDLFPLKWNPVVFTAILSAAFVPPIWAQVYRYRNVSTPTQRQQTKWVVYAMFIMLVSAFYLFVLRVIFPNTFEIGTIASDVLWLLTDVVFISLPIALLMAILRQRLWDVDILINRSLAYSVVAGAGLLVFFVTVVGLQLVIGQTQPVIALLVAGGFSLAVFRPLHERAQKIIDHNIYHFRFLVDDLRKADQAPEIKNPGALTGKQLGAYTVLGVLGKGGMGEVYKGQDGGNVVALKILADELAHQSEFLARFQREAQTGMALDHPHIVRVHDVGAADGVHYMAMDYVEGFDMARHLKQRSPMPPEDTIDLLKSIADALDYAHGQGLVHRDLKPSNVMLRPRADGETYDAVLMDFGIAKISGAGTRYTGTGTIGTIDYMAPEQITTAREVDRRADIYALGIMTYEMLTGKRPFEGSAPQVMFAHLQQPAPDPRDIQPDIPRTAAKAILKALEKNPDDRFDSAEAFLKALMGS